MENKKMNDNIKIVNVTMKPLTGVQLQIQVYKALEKYSKEVPTEKNAFIKFVKSKVTINDDQIIHNVWKQVRRLSPKSLDCSDPIIVISNEEVEENSKTKKIKDEDVEEENSKEKKYNIRVKPIKDLIEPIPKSVNVTKPADSRKRNSIGDVPKKRKAYNTKNNPQIDLEAEDLRRKLFIDKLVEVTMPSLFKKKKSKK